jgi:hypothetical protein
MKLAGYIKAVLLVAGIFLFTSCSTPGPLANAPRFAEEEAANFVARYYSDGTSYALKPVMMDGTFRTICNRALLLKLAGQQPQRSLAVVVLIHYQTAATEDSVKLAWVNDLKGLGYQRIVFLRAGKGMEVNGLPILEGSQSPAAFAGQ